MRTLLVAATLLATGAPSNQVAGPSSARSLSDAEKERFLLDADRRHERPGDTEARTTATGEPSS